MSSGTQHNVLHPRDANEEEPESKRLKAEEPGGADEEEEDKCNVRHRLSRFFPVASRYARTGSVKPTMDALAFGAGLRRPHVDRR